MRGIPSWRDSWKFVCWRETQFPADTNKGAGRSDIFEPFRRLSTHIHLLHFLHPFHDSHTIKYLRMISKLTNDGWEFTYWREIIFRGDTNKEADPPEIFIRFLRL
jgi:hypothetical protein